jgi:hypothetical protein
LRRVVPASNFLKARVCWQAQRACLRQELTQRALRRQSARWSPDGVCLLTNSDDNTLRVYDVPEDALVRLRSARSACAATETLNIARAARSGVRRTRRRQRGG